MCAKAANVELDLGLTLFIAVAGKTEHRSVDRFRAKEVPVRDRSQYASSFFSWDHEERWNACLKGVTSIYISYAPDLVFPGTRDAIQVLISCVQRAAAWKDLYWFPGVVKPMRRFVKRSFSSMEWTGWLFAQVGPTRISRMLRFCDRTMGRHWLVQSQAGM